MKYLIAGLGNMEPEYEDTRHNIGFKVVDHLAEEFECSFSHETMGDIAEFRHRSRTFVLLKPSTYMNNSGKAVRYWLQKKKIDHKRLLVVVDDINLPFGKQRLRPKGSHGGHNGLKSIDQMLGRSDYARLRIGIGSDFPRGRQVDYVLGKWTKEEKKKLPEIVSYAAETIKSFGTIGLQHSMNTYN
ncbi:MAG: aminoacyl-tRNA hydrolase [Saprospiraceae bacterium]|nr:aminoacyl-tRNA hydrolase [Saprospiraceae bacterium]